MFFDFSIEMFLHSILLQHFKLKVDQIANANLKEIISIESNLKPWKVKLLCVSGFINNLRRKQNNYFDHF